MSALQPKADCPCLKTLIDIEDALVFYVRIFGRIEQLPGVSCMGVQIMSPNVTVSALCLSEAIQLTSEAPQPSYFV